MTDVVAMLTELISLASINPMGDEIGKEDAACEADVAQYVYDFIKKLGLEPIVQQTSLAGRRNIGAMLYRGGQCKTVVLQTHMDTVGINGKEELLKPFVSGGRVYGRGACDDKGALACMLAALEGGAAELEQVKNNIIVMAVADEEYRGRGSYALIEQEPTRSADFGIVGEPTECAIVNGYKGIARWAIEVRGKACHSSKPDDGINAIYRMSEIIRGIRGYEKEISSHEDELLGRETISVGKISGGTAVNVVPDTCTIVIDRRTTRKTDPGREMETLEKYLRANGIDFEFQSAALSPSFKATIIGEEQPGMRMLKKVCGETGNTEKCRCVSFGSDAYRMNKAGIPTVLWGPGSIRNAHSDGEFVEIGELVRAVDFYRAVMRAEL